MKFKYSVRKIITTVNVVQIFLNSLSQSIFEKKIKVTLFHAFSFFLKVLPSMFATYGPISLRRPSRDEHPGPPLNQNINGS